MSGLSIATTGLKVAQQALDTIGTNIANASSEGYHRQDLTIASIDLTGNRSDTVQAGVMVTGVIRQADVLIDNQIRDLQPESGEVSQSLSTLETIEAMLGNSTSALGAKLNDFFNSLAKASADPSSSTNQQALVLSAGSLTAEFQTLDNSLSNVADNITLQAQATVDKTNSLLSDIADMNRQIDNIADKQGGAANILRDKRDAALLQLASIVNIQVSHEAVSGTVDVHIGSVPAITTVNCVEVSLQSTGNPILTLQVGGTMMNSDESGGKIGALLALRNDTIVGLQDTIDTIAKSLISGINQIHVQGVGTSGSFTELTGQEMPDGKINTWDLPVTSGTFYVRLTNTATGETTRTAVTIDPSQDTAATLATKLDSVGNLTASIADSKLHLQADNGYTFDFLPALSSATTTSTLSGTSSPTISGNYTGDKNQDFTFTVTSAGQVSIDSDVAVEVRNGTGDLVKTLNLGSGYAAGTAVEVTEGVSVAFSAGELKIGESFTTKALATSDPTGALAAAGLNTFFTGTDASSIAVSDDIQKDSGRFAFASGSDMSDNANALGMIKVGSRKTADLHNATLSDAFDQAVTTIGQRVETSKARSSAIDGAMQQLKTLQDKVSGVDINQETANMLTCQNYYQAIAKFLSITDESLDYLTNLLSR